MNMHHNHQALDSSVSTIVISGKQHEVRKATQSDLSSIHASSFAIANNNGWRRQLEDGRWNGMMIRPSA